MAKPGRKSGGGGKGCICRLESPNFDGAIFRIRNNWHVPAMGQAVQGGPIPAPWGASPDSTHREGPELAQCLRKSTGQGRGTLYFSLTLPMSDRETPDKPFTFFQPLFLRGGYYSSFPPCTILCTKWNDVCGPL